MCTAGILKARHLGASVREKGRNEMRLMFLVSFPLYSATSFSVSLNFSPHIAAFAAHCVREISKRAVFSKARSLPAVARLVLTWCLLNKPVSEVVANERVAKVLQSRDGHVQNVFSQLGEIPCQQDLEVKRVSNALP